MEYTTPSSVPDQTNSSSISKALAWDTPGQTKAVRSDGAATDLMEPEAEAESVEAARTPRECPGARVAGKGAGETAVGEAV